MRLRPGRPLLIHPPEPLQPLPPHTGLWVKTSGSVTTNTATLLTTSRRVVLQPLTESEQRSLAVAMATHDAARCSTSVRLCLRAVWKKGGAATPLLNVRQTWNVDVRVDVDVQCHPVGHTIDKNSLENEKKNGIFFQNWKIIDQLPACWCWEWGILYWFQKTKNSALTWWSICPHRVICYVYAHVYVYILCLPNLSISKAHSWCWGWISEKILGVLSFIDVDPNEASSEHRFAFTWL